jgi:chain length determinant protein tyrosine kinase EpsG
MQTELHHPKSPNIGKLLLEAGKLTPQQAEAVIAIQQEQGLRFGEAAIKLGFIKDDDITYVLSRQFSYNCLSADDTTLTEHLVAAFRPSAPEVEQLRSLRSQLMLRWMAEGNKAVTIVSHEGKAGTSFIAANLAIVFSQLGERTLLVDANLRNPSQHTLFKLDERFGLSDLLAGRADETCIRRVDKLIGLSVLTAGTIAPNPQELLSRPQFSQLLAAAAEAYDVVIVDAPPLVTSADAQVIASRTGGVVFVANRHQSSVSGLQEAAGRMQTAGALVLGCVLNKTR